MLTGSKKRTLAGICRLVTLPAAVLRSIGSFLTTYECFVAVRTCKDNEGLKPLLTSIEKIKVVRDDVLPGFVSVIEPSLISSIGCSVKFLDVNLYARNAGALVQLLHEMQGPSLQQFQILLAYEPLRLFEQVFHSIPQKLRCLTLGHVDAEALRCLGEAATAGCLPVLEELAFPTLNVRTIEDMAGLQTASMAPSLGRNLKKLFLDFNNFLEYGRLNRGKTWRLLEAVLNVEDQISGILSRLETIMLSSFTGWGMLAEYLLSRGRLPGLKEVYSRDYTEAKYIEIDPKLAHRGVAWYEVDSQTCRSWFELLYRRPLQTFSPMVYFFGGIHLCWDPELKKGRILELFRGLSNRALEPKCIASIKEVELMRNAHNCVCSDTVESLVKAMRSGNFCFIESLAVRATTRCSSESLVTLGKALDRAFLPCLTSFSFQLQYPDDGILWDVELEEWSLLLKSLFGSIPTGALDNLQKFELQMPPDGAGILRVLDALVEARPNCFRRLPELCLSDVSSGGFVEPKIMEKMALVFEAGIFPCVERVTISGGDETGDFGEGMPRLVRALGDHTNIKELIIDDLCGFEARWQISRPFLESMLALLSVSTSPAIFPFLQKLKVTLGPYMDGVPSSDYNSSTDYIERLLLCIKAVRPFNLKTIILGEIDGEKKI